MFRIISHCLHSYIENKLYLMHVSFLSIIYNVPSLMSNIGSLTLVVDTLNTNITKHSTVKLLK